MASSDPLTDGVPRIADRPRAALDAELQRSEIVKLLRYLYVHNPFYAISAVLVLLGLHSLFEDPTADDIGSIQFNNWMLLKLIAGYAVLLAGTACVIVRLNKVWEDARTIVLTLVLLIVSISVSSWASGCSSRCCCRRRRCAGSGYGCRGIFGGRITCCSACSSSIRRSCTTS
jgi:hypothetical protein